jgi:hypothetical protein
MHSYHVATVCLSAPKSRGRKNTRAANGSQQKARRRSALRLVLSRQCRRLWARSFSRTLTAERMRCDGRTACRADCCGAGTSGNVANGMLIGQGTNEPGVGSHLAVKPSPGQAE